jgi:hypothetical protein
VNGLRQIKRITTRISRGFLLVLLFGCSEGDDGS